MPKQTFVNLPEEKRNLIIDIAVDEFADNDYENVSISRLVARAGIAKGSFYQYFENKQDLLLYLLQLSGEEKFEFLQGKPPPEPDMNVFAYIRWMMEIGVGFQIKRPKMARVAYRAFYSVTPIRDETFMQMKEASEAFSRQLVERGIAQGDIDPNIDPHLATFMLSTVFNELGNYIFSRKEIDPEVLADGQYLDIMGTEEVQKILKDAVRILEYGLGVRPVPVSP